MRLREEFRLKNFGLQYEDSSVFYKMQVGNKVEIKQFSLVSFSSCQQKFGKNTIGGEHLQENYWKIETDYSFSKVVVKEDLPPVWSCAKGNQFYLTWALRHKRRLFPQEFFEICISFTVCQLFYMVVPWFFGVLKNSCSDKFSKVQRD